MGSRLSDVSPKQEALLHVLGNRSLTAGGLAIHGTNKENVKTANALTYTVNGIFYAKSAQTEIDISALTFLDKNGDARAVTAQPDGQVRYYLLALDISGNIRALEGEDGGNWPACPPEHAPFGGIKVENGSGSSFTLGTTALNTSNVTVTYSDIAIVPAAISS